jgi:class 3 adenylate cyclase
MPAYLGLKDATHYLGHAREGKNPEGAVHPDLIGIVAYECLHRCRELMQKLEVSLGPGATDLAMRFGLHSGPVTAGVLSGEKARFQLFGDTINTAARMENTGQKNKIHSSQATATLLVKAGKDYWFVVREKHVTAKGKGEMQTYWVNTRKCLMKGKGNREAVPPENNAHD